MIHNRNIREVYLQELRGSLNGLPAPEVEEILREISADLIERSTIDGRIDSIRERQAVVDLGPAEDLGRLYLVDSNLRAARVSRSPHKVLHSLFQWSTISVAGFFTLLVGLLGYGTAAVLILSAALKPLFPASIGLWYRSHPFAISIGYKAMNPGSLEVLGWALIPVSLVAGLLTLVLTTRITSWSTTRFTSLRPERTSR